MTENLFVRKLDLFYGQGDRLDLLSWEVAIDSGAWHALVDQMHKAYKAAHALIEEATKLVILDKYLYHVEQTYGPLPKGRRCSIHSCPISLALGGRVVVDIKGKRVYIGGSGGRPGSDPEYLDDPLLAAFIKRFDRGYYPQLIQS